MDSELRLMQITKGALCIDIRRLDGTSTTREERRAPISAVLWYSPEATPGPGFWACLGWTSRDFSIETIYIQSALSRRVLFLSPFNIAVLFISSLLSGVHHFTFITSTHRPLGSLGSLVVFVSTLFLSPFSLTVPSGQRYTSSALAVIVHLSHVIAQSFSDPFIFMINFVQTL